MLLALDLAESLLEQLEVAGEWIFGARNEEHLPHAPRRHPPLSRAAALRCTPWLMPHLPDQKHSALQVAGRSVSFFSPQEDLKRDRLSCKMLSNCNACKNTQAMVFAVAGGCKAWQRSTRATAVSATLLRRVDQWISKPASIPAVLFRRKFSRSCEVPIIFLIEAAGPSGLARPRDNALTRFRQLSAKVLASKGKGSGSSQTGAPCTRYATGF